MNNLTTLAKRLRPLIASVAKSVADSSVSGYSNFAVPVHGLDYTDGDLFYGAGGIWLDGGHMIDVHGVWRVPDTYNSETITFSVMFKMSGAGDIACKFNLYRQRCGATIATDTESSYVAATMAAGGIYECEYDKSPSFSVQAGDVIQIIISRAGSGGSGADDGENGFITAFLVSM